MGGDEKYKYQWANNEYEVLNITIYGNLIHKYIKYYLATIKIGIKYIINKVNILQALKIYVSKKIKF